MKDSMTWFRLYADLPDDPKVQFLPAETFRTWINLLCIAARTGGILPSAAVIAFTLRIPESGVQNVLDEMVALDLIDVTPGGLVPHNWEKRQYKSDSSTARVKEHRDRKRSRDTFDGPTTNTGNVSGNVAGNVPVTAQRQRQNTETETEGRESKSARENGAGKPGGPTAWDGLEDLRSALAIGLDSQPPVKWAIAIRGLMQPAGSPAGAKDGNGKLHNGYTREQITDAIERHSAKEWRSVDSLIAILAGTVKDRGATRSTDFPVRPMTYTQAEQWAVTTKTRNWQQVCRMVKGPDGKPHFIRPADLERAIPEGYVAWEVAA